jgi:hypothetical protein
MVRVHIHCSFEVLDGSQRISAICPDAPHLKGILCAAGGSSSNAAEHFFGFVDATGSPNSTGATECATDRIDAGLCSSFEAGRSFVGAIERYQTLTMNQQCNTVASNVAEEAVSLSLPREEIGADPGAGHKRLRFFSCIDTPHRFTDGDPEIRQLSSPGSDFELVQLVEREQIFGFENFANVNCDWGHFGRFLSDGAAAGARNTEDKRGETMDCNLPARF